jgi:cupin 2 domain-containing protein
MTTAKLLTNLLPNPPSELFTTLLESANLRIERIVSDGRSSREGFWHDQQQHQRVVKLKVPDRLRFEGDEQPVDMKPGDFMNIPARKKHRGEWTAPNEPTIWRAVH